MAKTLKDSDVNVPREEFIPLDEYCRRLSENDSRVELIGGFEASERASGRLKATVVAFDAAFSAFVSRPA